MPARTRDPVSAKDLKRFCAAPSLGAVVKSSGALTTVCGECCLNALFQNLVTFAKTAVEAHNAARLAECERYMRENEDDEVDSADLFADFLPDPDYLHEKMTVLEEVMMELGCTHWYVEQDETDGTIQLDDVVDCMSDRCLDDVTINEMKEAMKTYGIPTAYKRKVSFVRGSGIRTHEQLTCHDVDMGKTFL